MINNSVEIRKVIKYELYVSGERLAGGANDCIHYPRNPFRYRSGTILEYKFTDLNVCGIIYD